MKTPDNKHNAEHISADELQRYFDGEMSNAEMRALEQKLDNDFNSDAFDGFEANRNALADMDALKSRFENEVIGQKGAGSSNTVRYLTYATGIAAILVIGFFIFKPNEPYLNPEQLEKVMPTAVVDSAIADSDTYVVEESADTFLFDYTSPSEPKDEINNNLSVGIGDIISTEKDSSPSLLLKQESFSLSPTNNEGLIGVYDNIPEPDYTSGWANGSNSIANISLSDTSFILLDIAEEDAELENAKPLEPALQITYSNTVQDQRDFSYVEAEEIAARGYEMEDRTDEKEDKKPLPIKYIIDLKVVNYDSRETPEVNDSDKIELLRERHKSKSISPRFSNPDNYAKGIENNNNVNYWNTPKVTEIPYDDFLEEALSKFKKQDFKDAIDDFTIILDTYPEDANALFYAGLCYYNLNLPDRAINYFGLLQQTPFDEEAAWYEALSYKLKDDDATAKKLLQNIAKANGFYAKRAQEMLTNY